MDHLQKLMEKRSKGQEPMEASKKEAKMKALMNLKSSMREMMGDGIKDHLEGMKKVTVAADSDKGLKEGLEHAEEMVAPEEQEDDRTPMERAMVERQAEESSESPEQEMSEPSEHEMAMDEAEPSKEDMMRMIMEMRAELKQLKGE